MDERAAEQIGTTDPVAQMRRRLEELLTAGGATTSGPARSSRLDESDPQRARPADYDSAGPRTTSGRRGAGIPAADTPGGSVEQAKDACLRLLAVRARSRAELAQRLSTKGFSEDVAETALELLAEVGLIDDADFAQQWVRQRHSFSGKGRQALAQELRRKGVSPEDAAPALDSVTADDEYERATDLVRRKLRTLPPGLDRDKAFRRLVGMLARRGYSHSVSYAVVKDEWAASRSDSATEQAGEPLD